MTLTPGPCGSGSGSTRDAGRSGPATLYREPVDRSPERPVDHGRRAERPPATMLASKTDLARERSAEGGHIMAVDGVTVRGHACGRLRIRSHPSVRRSARRFFGVLTPSPREA